MLDGLDNLEDQSNSLREELSAQSQILMEPASEYLADLTEKMTEAQEVEGGVIESQQQLRLTRSIVVFASSGPWVFRLTSKAFPPIRGF